MKVKAPEKTTNTLLNHDIALQLIKKKKSYSRRFIFTNDKCIMLLIRTNQ